MNSGPRPQLPHASSSCSCCGPAQAAPPAATLPAPSAQASPAAVVHPGSPATPAHLSHHSG